MQQTKQLIEYCKEFKEALTYINNKLNIQDAKMFHYIDRFGYINFELEYDNKNWRIVEKNIIDLKRRGSQIFQSFSNYIGYNKDFSIVKSEMKKDLLARKGMTTSQINIPPPVPSLIQEEIDELWSLWETEEYTREYSVFKKKKECHCGAKHDIVPIHLDFCDLYKG